MKNTYYTTIGLEIHAELKTNAKMFCACKNNPDEEEANRNICPVCMAHPGTLPVINKKAVENVIRVGLALNGEIADFTEFDRKNYFYPDIPKAYQISQYKYPIVKGGTLKGVDITRIHLEEDTATSKHEKNYSLVDFNRAGVPLMELVTEPVIHSPEEAGIFARELQLTLQYLGVSDANMEKGEMRVELNISISPDKDVFGTKVEVKNINSFKAMEKAARFEIERMGALLDEGKGDQIVQETRGWDETKGITFSQRKKENSEDYRYFPDPDLPKLSLHTLFDLQNIKETLPMLPEEKRALYTEKYGIKLEDIEVYINDSALSLWFEGVAGVLPNKESIVLASNYITSDIVGLLKKETDATLPHQEHFVELVHMVSSGELNSRVAKDILALLVMKDFSPKEYANTNGLIQKNDEGYLIEVAQKIIQAHPQVVEEYKNGKEASLMFFVGQMMKETKGSANPTVTKELLIKLLK